MAENLWILERGRKQPITFLGSFRRIKEILQHYNGFEGIGTVMKQHIYIY